MKETNTRERSSAYKGPKEMTGNSTPIYDTGHDPEAIDHIPTQAVADEQQERRRLQTLLTINGII